MRAALLPAGADPFLLTYWLRHFRMWAGEVDELRVQVSGLMGNDDIRDYLSGYVRDMNDALTVGPEVILTFSDERVDHGTVIGRLLSETSADHVMLCEDDAFVRKAGVVDAAFRRVESGSTDIVACPRATATPEVLQAAANAAAWVISPSGESGTFMWPCFLFARASDLRRVTVGYSVKHWLPGDEITGTGKIATVEGDADTFAAASMELLGMGLRVHWESQYRVDEALMDGWHDAPWFHVGSLSGSTEYLLNKRLPPDRPAWIADVRQSSDWVKRISWWLRVLDSAEGLPELRDRLRAELVSVIADAEIPEEALARWTRRLDPFVTWDRVPA